MAPRTPRKTKNSAPTNPGDGEQAISVPLEETLQATPTDAAGTQQTPVVPKDQAGLPTTQTNQENQANPLVFAATKDGGLSVIPAEGEGGKSPPPTLAPKQSSAGQPLSNEDMVKAAASFNKSFGKGAAKNAGSKASPSVRLLGKSLISTTFPMVQLI
jgi:hypothetical protein